MNNLNPFEKQIVAAEKDSLTVSELPLSSFDGLIVDTDIYIRSNMPIIQKACVLAEERGHHYTGIGDILDQGRVENRKLEMKGRRWAYDDRIGLYGIIKSFRGGDRSLYEMADRLEVTEEFLCEALEYYRSKYGICTYLDNYIIFFEPTLSVVRKLD